MEGWTDVGDDGWPVAHTIESGERSERGRCEGEGMMGMDGVVDGGVGELAGGGWRDGDEGGTRGLGAEFLLGVGCVVKQGRSAEEHRYAHTAFGNHSVC